MTTTAPLKPISDKQLAFAKQLINDKDVPADTVIPDTSKKASELIDWLLRQPRKPKAAVPTKTNTGVTVELSEGIYLAPNGDVIKLQLSKSSGKLYAKVAMAISGERMNFHGDVVNFEYVYVPGVVSHITPAMKMDAAQAQDFALRSGRCAWCRKAIKTASSLAAGVGPVCAKKFS